MLHAVIMAGGSGTRFWPASRADRPKQLLNLAGERSMIQGTVDRLEGLVGSERLLVVTNQRLVNAIHDQLPELPLESIIGEPCKRDTAPCIGLAAHLVMARDPDATMCVMPADHVIQPESVFREAIQYAVDSLEQDPTQIVTFGIKPTYPAEIFGYIERTGENLAKASQPPTFQVARFREKPDRQTAQEFLEQGTFYWNSGIFLWKAKTILDALRENEPEMCAHLDAIGDSIGESNFASVLDKEFHAIKGKSIDFAVMEHFKNVSVIEAPFGWDDVGNWPALERLNGTDDNGNTISGKHLAINTERTIIRSEGDHLLVTLGLEDCIVVHTENATLVAKKSEEEAIRKVVKELEEKGWSEYL